MIENRNYKRLQLNTFHADMDILIHSFEGIDLKGELIDISLCGLRIKFSEHGSSNTDQFNKSDMVKVLFTDENTTVSGSCVYSNREPDNRLTIGLYVSNPFEQIKLADLIEKYFVTGFQDGHE